MKKQVNKNSTYDMYRLTGGYIIDSVIINASSFEEAKIKANQRYVASGLIGRYYLESDNGYIEQINATY